MDVTVLSAREGSGRTARIPLERQRWWWRTSRFFQWRVRQHLGRSRLVQWHPRPRYSVSLDRNLSPFFDCGVDSPTIITSVLLVDARVENLQRPVFDWSWRFAVSGKTLIATDIRKRTPILIHSSPGIFGGQPARQRCRDRQKLQALTNLVSRRVHPLSELQPP